MFNIVVPKSAYRRQLLNNKPMLFDTKYQYNTDDYLLTVKIMNRLFDGSENHILFIAKLMVSNAGRMQYLQMDLEGAALEEFNELYKLL